MQKNTIYIIAAIVILLAGGGGFYGGIIYGKTQTGSGPAGNLSGQRQWNGQTPVGAGTRTINRQMNGNGFVSGQIIAKDDKSITVKSQDGGSKIVFLADSTQITKSASGTASDLANDINVMVNGTANSDGSITAKYVQIRPDQGAMMPVRNQNMPDQPPAQQ